MLSCEYFLDSASERGMTRARHPAHNAGSRRGQARLSFTGSLPVFTSCCILPLRLLSGFRVGARNDKNASPRTSIRGPEEDKRDIHLQGLCRYLPHAVFSLCGYSLDSASERGMTRTRHPAPRFGGQKRTNETFIYRVFAGIYLMRYSHFAATLWIPRRSAE